MTTSTAPQPSLPAVVLLHSSMSSSAQWAALSAQHGAGFRFIAVDLLGYGKSAFPQEIADHGFSLEHEVDAVMAALAGRLGAGEPFHLVGHSYGGATALRLARQLGNRVLSLTLFEPVAFHLLPPHDGARIDIESVVASIERAPTRHDATRIFIDYWNRAGVFGSLPAAQQERFTAHIDKVKLDFQALLGEPATLADLAPLAMPALVMHGIDGPASTRRVAERLAAALPNASLKQTKGGHMGPITHAAAINPLIVEFLMEVEVLSN